MKKIGKNRTRQIGLIILIVITILLSGCASAEEKQQRELEKQREIEVAKAMNYLKDGVFSYRNEYAIGEEIKKVKDTEAFREWLDKRITEIKDGTYSEEDLLTLLGAMESAKCFDAELRDSVQDYYRVEEAFNDLTQNLNGSNDVVQSLKDINDNLSDYWRFDNFSYYNITSNIKLSDKILPALDQYFTKGNRTGGYYGVGTDETKKGDALLTTRTKTINVGDFCYVVAIKEATANGGYVNSDGKLYYKGSEVPVERYVVYNKPDDIQKATEIYVSGKNVVFYYSGKGLTSNFYSGIIR